MNALVRIGTAAIALAASSPAAAQSDDGFPIDVELMRPGLSPRGGFAVDAPHRGGRFGWSTGALVQYELAPLRLFDREELLGALVAHRTVVQLHGGVAISERTSLSVMLPVSAHFGAGDVERARNGAGLGDASLALRVHAGTWRRFSLGVLGTLLLPTGNPNQYMGERLPRLRAGLLGHTDLGRVSVLTNLLALVREPVPTGYDFTAGSELQLDLGLQATVRPDVDLIAEVVSRVGLARGTDGGRLASEAVAGVRYRPGGGLRVDVGLGRGLTGGYGTTSVRALLGLSWVAPPKPPPPEPEPPPPEPEPELVDDPLPEEEDPPPPPPPEIARLDGEEIEIRDPIEFELGTAVLRDSSGPILEAVAGILLGNPAIGHVVIEGHASQEGDFAYNYRLSLERARAIYEALILRGVHPKRLSYRGAGEVEEVVAGDDAAALERNRRVVFQVVRTYAPGEPRPALPSQILLPWSGEPHETREPPPPEPPPEPPPDDEPTPARDLDDVRFDEPDEAEAPAPEETP